MISGLSPSSSLTAKTEIRESSSGLPAASLLLLLSIYSLTRSAAPSGSLRVFEKPILTEPELVNSLIRASGGIVAGVAADYFSLFNACLPTSSLYRNAKALTSYTPPDNRATRGTGVKSFSTGTSSTFILTISICSSLSGGISMSGKPATLRTLGITFSSGSTVTASVSDY